MSTDDDGLMSLSVSDTSMSPSPSLQQQLDECLHREAALRAENAQLKHIVHSLLPHGSPVRTDAALSTAPWLLSVRNGMTADSINHLPWMRVWTELFPAPPIPADDEYRCKVVDQYRILDTAEEEVFTNLCRIARVIFNVPLASINIVAKDRVWFKAAVNSMETMNGVNETPRSVSLCNYTVAKKQTVVIPDLNKDAMFRHNPVYKDFAVRFYAGSPLTNSNGFCIGAFCLVDDKPNNTFTEVQQATLDLLASSAMSYMEIRRYQLERRRMNTRFITNISHQLRTPIHGIMGLCETLLKNKVDVDETIHEILRQTRSLLLRSNEIIDFHEIEANHLVLYESSVALPDLIVAACKEAQQLSGGTRTALRLTHPYQSKSVVQADRARLAQIAFVIISNAIKFNRNDADVLVTIAHSTSEPPFGTSGLAVASDNMSHPSDTPMSESANPRQFYWSLRVDDRGCGIAPDMVVSAFDVFGNFDAANRHTFVGSGLGLWMCAKLAALMSGYVQLSSVQHVGTSVQVVIKLAYADDQPFTAQTQTTLIRADDAVDDADLFSRSLALRPNFVQNALDNDNNNNTRSVSERATSFPSVSSAVLVRTSDGATSALQSPAPTVRALPSPRQLNILIVDDVMSNIKVAKRMLSLARHHCSHAMNGLEALNVAQQRRFDLILLDVQMPIMDGLEAAKRIRDFERSAGFPSTPIIAVTATAMADVRLLCFQVGMNGYLTKPFSRSQLDTCIAGVLAARSDEPRLSEIPQTNGR